MQVTQDEELINTLEEAKRLAHEVEAKMSVANETQRTINTTAEQYRSVAARGAILFFLMNSLDKVHTYYMYSLNAFVVVFLRGIESADGALPPGTPLSPSAPPGAWSVSVCVCLCLCVRVCFSACVSVCVCAFMLIPDR